MKTSRLSPCLAALLVAHLPWQSAQAATGTWTGAGGATWDTTATHWTGVSGTPWDSTNGLTDTALFSAAATPAVSGTVYVNTLTINAATTISGGTLTLAGSSPTINGTGAGTIYSVLAGTNGLIKSGTGSAVLDPGNGWWENTFSGDITVNGGTLTTVRTTSLGNDGVGAGTITVNAGATLSVEWSNITRTGLVTVDGGIFSTNSYGPAGIINNGDGFLLKNAAAVSAILGGTAGLTVEGAGVTYLWRQATYTGATTISSGQLAIAGAGGIAATSAVSIASGASINLTSSYAPDNINRTIGGLTGAGVLYGGGTGTVTVNKTSGTDTFGGDIQGAQGLIKDGAGTLELTGTNTYSGNTTVSNGVLAVGGAGKLGNGSYSGAVSLAGASSVLQIATSASQTLSGAISGSGSLAKSGAGTLTLSGSNSYAGCTTVDGGKLTASHANALGDAACAVTVSGGAVLEVNANMTRTGTVTVNGGDLSSGNSSTITNNGGGFVFTGSAASSGAAVLAGSSGLAASSDDARLWTQATYSGATTVTSGTLRICGGGGIPTTSVVSIASGAAVNLTSFYAPTDINRTIGGLTGAGILYGGGTGTVTVNKTSGTDTFSGDIQGAQGLIKDGAGTLELTGPNTYTGATAVNLGTLALVGGSQASPITVSSGAALGFTLGSPTTSSSTVTFSGATAKVSVTGTPAAATLMTATSITGTPVLDPAIPGFSLAIEDGGTTLKLKSSGTTFAAWQLANSTTGAIDADHDNDGVPNGVEYFLMGTANSTGFTALPPVDNSGGTLSVTWTKAAGYTGSYGTGFRVETSATLTGTWNPEAIGGNVSVSGNSYTYTFPTPLGARGFARLVVTDS